MERHRVVVSEAVTAVVGRTRAAAKAENSVISELPSSLLAYYPELVGCSK